VYLRIDGDRITGISFEGSGCAISKASASLMTDEVRGRSLAEAGALFDRFHAMVTTPIDQPVDEAALGKLSVLAGVREPTPRPCRSRPSRKYAGRTELRSAAKYRSDSSRQKVNGFPRSNARRIDDASVIRARP
jgi:NifU-like protein